MKEKRTQSWGDGVGLIREYGGRGEDLVVWLRWPSSNARCAVRSTGAKGTRKAVRITHHNSHPPRLTTGLDMGSGAATSERGGGAGQKRCGSHRSG